MYLLIGVACFLFWGAFQKNADYYYYWGLFLLFLVTAFRHPALGGTDNFVYYQLFVDVPPLSDVFDYESPYRIGYLLFVSLSKTISDSYLFFQVFYTSVCMMMLNKIIKMLELHGKEECLFLFSLWCGFFFIWDFWVLFRQNIANLIFAYLLLSYIKNRQNLNVYKKFTILLSAVIIPYMFHSSALFNSAILLIYLMLPKKDAEGSRILWVSLLSVLLFIIGTAFFSFFTALAVSIDDRYTQYAEDSGVSSNIINFVFKLIMFALFCINYKNISYKYKRDVLNLSTLYLLIGSINVGIIGRVASYYSYGSMASRAFVGRFNKPISYIPFWFFLAMMIIFIRHLFVMSAGLNSHYIFFWESISNLPPDYRTFWINANIL